MVSVIHYINMVMVSVRQGIGNIVQLHPVAHPYFTFTFSFRLCAACQRLRDFKKRQVLRTKNRAEQSTKTEKESESEIRYWKVSKS
jgi:hypothetical protein